MITEVVMERELFGCKVLQKSKSQFFCAKSLVDAGNRWRINNGLAPFNLSYYFSLEATKQFIAEITAKYGTPKMSKAGKGGFIWVHPLLFIDIALAISPKLKLEVYEWMHDELCKYRQDSGDSYKRMTGALYARHKNTRTFPDYIADVALKIQKACAVKDWQTASKEQLKMRDKIQENIEFLADVLNNNDKAVETSLAKARKALRSAEDL